MGIIVKTFWKWLGLKPEPRTKITLSVAQRMWGVDVVVCVHYCLLVKTTLFVPSSLKPIAIFSVGWDLTSGYGSCCNNYFLQPGFS